MPTPTYTPLANITLSASTANVTFSSISGSYRDLVLVVNWLSTGSGFTQFGLRYNGDSGSNYSKVYMNGNGSTTASGAASGESFADSAYMATATSSSPTSVIINILDYSATDKHKTALSRSNDTAGQVLAYTNRWASTAAITSVQLYGSTSNQFAAGTTMALYGIAS